MATELPKTFEKASNDRYETLILAALSGKEISDEKTNTLIRTEGSDDRYADTQQNIETLKNILEQQHKEKPTVALALEETPTEPVNNTEERPAYTSNIAPPAA